MWFKQDGAISHTTNETPNFLQRRFQDRAVSRACLDLFVWGFLKKIVYVDNPQQFRTYVITAFYSLLLQKSISNLNTLHLKIISIWKTSKLQYKKIYFLFHSFTV